MPLLLIMLCTLLPSVSMWLGLYVVKSAIWTYVFYHGFCLLPVIVLGKNLWLKTWRAPELKYIILLLLGSIILSAATVLLYEWKGHVVLSNDNVFALLNRIGYTKEAFWPLSFYIVVVNPLVEELYWRGVILNKLDQMNLKFKHFGLIWSSLMYAAFHYWICRLFVFSGWAEIGTIMLAFYGGMLAFIYRRTGSIITTAIAHGLLTDMAAVMLLLDFLRRYPSLL